jgi:threonine efflux protein
MIVSNASITGSRRLGLFAVCGVLLATLTWALLSAIGLGVVIARFPALYTALQVAGALYLIWLGVKMLVTALRQRPSRTIRFCRCQREKPCDPFPHEYPEP